jgi:hypothetical protein
MLFHLKESQTLLRVCLQDLLDEGASVCAQICELNLAVWVFALQIQPRDVFIGYILILTRKRCMTQ